MTATSPAATRTFEYKGRDASGALVKGKIDAPSEGAVVQRLRSMQILPLGITEAGKGTGLNRDITIPAFEKGVKLTDLSVMSRQMATMISSGLSLIRTLTILSEQTEHKVLAKTLGEVRLDVETGGALSDSFAKHARVFPPIMIHLIRAGETGGFLEGALESIADNFENEVKLKATIKSAMTYPVVVFAMAILAVVAMLLFVVPIF